MVTAQVAQVIPEIFSSACFLISLPVPGSSPPLPFSAAAMHTLPVLSP
jgi:hypothetical protein